MSELTKRTLARTLLLTCALSASLALVACGSSQADDGGSSTTGNNESAAEFVATGDTPEGDSGTTEEVSADDTTATDTSTEESSTEEVSASEDTSSGMSTEVSSGSTEESTEETNTEVDAGISEAERLAEFERKLWIKRTREDLAAGNVAGALKRATYAADSFPEDKQIADLLAEVQEAASDTMLGGMSDAEQLRMTSQQEFEREAERLMENARTSEESNEWARALRSYSDLIKLIRFAPYQAELREKYFERAEAGRRNAQVEVRRKSEAQEIEQQVEAARREQLRKLAVEQRQNAEVVRLWRQALYNMDLRRFNEARKLTERVLAIDANFRQAEQLKAEIDARQLQDLKRETYERRMLGYRTALIQLRQAMVPDTRRVVYPTGEIAKLIRDRQSKRPDNVRLPKEQLALEGALEATIIGDFSFIDRPLSEVIQRIRQEASVNILLGEGAEPDEEVNVDVSNLSAAACLNIVMKQLELRSVFANGILQIVEDGSDIRQPLVTRVHDIRDITYVVGDFQAPRLNLRDANDTGGLLPPPPDGDDQIDSDTVLDLIESSIHRDIWGDTERGIIVQFGGQLVVTASPQVQADVRDFLQDLRRTAGLLVAMEARFITIQDDFLQDFGIDFRGLGGPASVPNQANLILEDVRSQEEDNAGGAFDNGALGVPTANPSAGIFFNNDSSNGPVNFNRDIRGRFENIFDNALGNRLSNVGGLAMQVAIFEDLTQLNMVIEAVQKKGRGRTLVAPRLSAFNTQRANIGIINQIPYIQDFEVQTAATSAIANPIIDTILDGIVMEVRPTISNDRRFITLEVQPTVADLLLPIPTFVTVLGPTSAVTIQIPELRIQSAKTTVRVPDGGAVVIGGLKTVREIDRESSTPILGDLPLIGFLFRRKARVRERENLVIVVKADVVDLNDLELQQPGWAD